MGTYKYQVKEKCQQVDTSSEDNLPYLLRWKGSVTPNVIFQTLFVTAFAAAVAAVYIKTDIKPSIPQTFIPVLGFVVGLLLTYRTNTAYDRYWEGRRAWSSMVVAIRNLTRYIWVGIKRKKSDKEKKANEEDKKMKFLKKKKEVKTEQKSKQETDEKIMIEEEEKEILIEKESAIRLLIGFAIAVKHYLREEEGNDCKDIKPFISDIKSSLPGFENLMAQDAVENASENTIIKNTPRGESIWSKIINLYNDRKKPHQRGKKEVDIDSPNHNLPLEISIYLSDYVTTQLDEGRVSVPVSNSMLQNVNTLIECLSSFERILRTPIPLAYAIHLSQTVWIYCLSLPFQLVASVGWSTIPIVFFASFILLGIERIAAEIENPFGYDPNDLDLDGFCRIIERELKTITNHPPPDVDHWVFNDKNRPFDDHKISALYARKNLSFDEVRSRFSVKSIEEENTDNENHVNDKKDVKSENEITIDVKDSK
ncbi:11521_t:CDS:2 [Dentiscutata heterogama]|uniref:11521_t:CDS:1 n=1 Tax=Dentiscutata heterogama TaxID=1316150 RepID=A0ACA9LYP8_9GLOM|nr:11521_t:CDS:2 [Dentiscutata heterogama]